MDKLVETATPTSAQNDQRSHPAAAIILLILVPLVIFTPSVLRDHFVNWDDEGQLYQNPDFNPPTFQSVMKYWYTPHMNLYMPISYSLWGIVSEFAGTKPDSSGIALDPVWFHGLNLLLHIGATLAIFAILRRFVGTIWPACGGAMLFAIHPIQTEAVCWASGMYTILSGLFIFLAIYQFIRYAQSRGKQAAIHYLIATALFIVAVLSKPSAVVALPMAGIIDVLLIRRRWRTAILSLLPWLIGTVPIIAILHRAQPAAIVPNEPPHLRALVCLDSTGFYLAKLLYPLNFAADYGRNPHWLRSHPMASWMAILPIALLALSVMAKRKFPSLLAGFGLLVTGTLPFLGLVKFDFQHFSTVADRYAYPGMLGLALVAAAALSRWRSTPFRFIAVAILAGLALLTYCQASVWHDTRSLFTHNLQVNPHSLQAHSNLGFLDMSGGNSDEAIEHYRQALATDPNDPDANTDLANALRGRGDLSEAIDHYHRALQITPDDPRIENNLGIALAQSHQYEQAVREFQAALDHDGSNPQAGKDVRADAHTNLAIILEQAGRPDQAAEQYRSALAIDPHFQLARMGLNKLTQTQNPQPPPVR